MGFSNLPLDAGATNAHPKVVQLLADEIMKFPGLTSFYRRIIRCYITIATLLRKF